MIEIKNYIGGELVAPQDGEYLDNINPATKEVYSKIPNSKSADALKAIQAAKAAFPVWSSMTKDERIEIMLKIASLLKAKREELATAESIDNGKPKSLAYNVDMARCFGNIEYYCEEAKSFGEETFTMEDGSVNYITHEPLGVVTCITPWNLPLYLFTWKIAPALIAGNTVVGKPSEVTPMTAFMFSEICIEAGLPPGVLNILHGTGANIGETITTHPDVKAVSFTGSTATGQIIAKAAAPLMKKISLEMGGKNPNIIFADADYDHALETSVRSSFSNQGQICLCGSRIFIEKSIYEKFKTDFVNKSKELVQGDPLHESTDQGAVVSEAHFNKIINCIETAKAEGGNILLGGGANEELNGFFVKPTIIENLDSKAKTNQDEIFGPVVTITSFETEDEVIDWANCTEYGLAGSIWTTDIEKAKRVASKIDSGVLWINTWMKRDLRTPFGGMKNSGVGREGGKYALSFFTQPKNICIDGASL